MVHNVPRDDQLFMNIFMSGGKIADVRVYSTYAAGMKDREAAGYDHVFPAYCSGGIIYVLPKGAEYTADNFIPAESIGLFV